MNPRTAGPDQSIWRDLPEETFRLHLVKLEERTNAVPMDVQQFSHSTIIKDPHNYAYALSIGDEQSLADAFAFLVAVEEGAQSVAAVCLEEDIQNEILTVRFAAVDTVSKSLQQALQQVCKILSDSTGPIMDSRNKIDELFHFTTRLHFRRILARLRSSKWMKPSFLSRSHKKPLWQDFANLIHRVQFLYSKKQSATRNSLEKQLESLAELYSSFESTLLDSDEEFSHLLHLIRTSYDYCTSGIMRDYTSRLIAAGSTSQVRAALKTLRQIEKIAAYYRVSNTLIRVSRRYLRYFQGQNLRLIYLSPYTSIPTSIGYEAWAKTCHVHAEVQLVVYYDLNSHFPSRSESSCTEKIKTLPPRVIGTSKYLCYLCYLFIKAHSRFSPANTHGRLYDQWSIPDLAEFSDEQRGKYRDIVREMYDEVGNQAAKPPLWRQEPMTSRENLLDAALDES